MKANLTGENVSANAKQDFANAKQKDEHKGSATLAESLFEAWEKRTSEYCERLLRNPSVLSAVGGFLTASYKNKIFVEKTLTAMWKNLNLPNKRDQERTLHLLNELHSRIFDLEERLAKATEQNATSAARKSGSRPGPTASRPTQRETHAARDI